MSPVASYIFVLIHPRTLPPPLNQTVSFASNPNSGWCVPKQVLSGVYLPDFGSHTAACRSDSLIGKAFADGRSEPGRQYAGFSRPRVDAASHTRPFASTIELWLLTRVSQICSSPQYADGAIAFRPAACPGPRLSGICGSSTVAWNVVIVCFTGSRTGRVSVLYSGEPYSGPYALTVGFRLSVAMMSCR